LTRELAVGTEFFKAHGFFVGETGAGDDVLIFFLGEPPDDFLRRNGGGSWRDWFRANAMHVMFRGRRERALLSGLGRACRTREYTCAKKKRAVEYGSETAAAGMWGERVHDK
jgi:hypothetical protein